MNDFFLDIIHLFSAVGCDCYLQVPDLDKDFS